MYFFLNTLHRAKFSQIITDALFSIGMSLVYSICNDVNMSSINGSNNSRKAHNPHKSGLFWHNGLAVSWKVNKLLYRSGQSDVRPRKIDIFTLNKKKEKKCKIL